VRTLALAAAESAGALFPIVDPIGNSATFVALTRDQSAERRRVEARNTAIIVASILIVFLIIGEPLLRLFGISLEALQIAGGLVVGTAGFQMVTGFGWYAADAPDKRAGTTVAFTPMAMPLLAGPGAMGIVLGFEARGSEFLAFPGFAVGILLISAVVYACLRLGDRIVALIGTAGLIALTRMLGLIVLAIGVELIVHGIVEHGAVVALD
jgi:multiple antibiotic resistance protein